MEGLRTGALKKPRRLPFTPLRERVGGSEPAPRVFPPQPFLVDPNACLKVFFSLHF